MQPLMHQHKSSKVQYRLGVSFTSLVTQSQNKHISSWFAIKHVVNVGKAKYSKNIALK